MESGKRRKSTYKPRHAKKGPLRIILLISLILLLVLGSLAGAVLFKKNELPLLKPKVIPAAIKATYETRHELCKPFELKEFECKVTWKTSETLPVGDLIKQVPKAGVRSDEVELFYSKGKELVSMPIIAGFSTSAAKKILWEAGLEAGKETEVDVASPTGTVVSSKVEPAAKIGNGTKIDFSMSTGKVLVPDWLGKSQELVVAEASELGLKVNFTSKVSKRTQGTVIKEALASQLVPFEQVIELVLAKSNKTALVEIPNVVGMEQPNAISLLASRGFLKIKTIVKVKPGVKGSKVVAVIPKVKKKIDASKEITLIVQRKK